MSSDIKIRVDMGEAENTCFVIMPFEPLFETEYESSLRPAIETVGLKCVKADEVYAKARIIDDIWKCIRSCRIVLAELTGRNPNVLYELGLAHAVGKPVIIITREESDVPFDLRALRYLYYDINDPFWGENLQKALKSMLESVIKEEDIRKYLDGISPNEIEYPALPVIKPQEKVTEEKVENVSGIWRVSFGIEDQDEHNGLMNIEQNGRELSATMTVTYGGDSGETSVVQEVFSGSIDKEKVNLRGVNYSWVKKAEDDSYSLDNFEVVLSQKKRGMRGIFRCRGSSGKALFQKRGKR